MQSFQEVKDSLINKPRRWLVTGAAGFIGSNIVEALLKMDQYVIGLDNFATGHRYNLDDIKDSVGPDCFKNFTFIEGSIEDYEICLKACKNIDFVSNQAAIGSVPRSISDPIPTFEANVRGFVNIMHASMISKVKSFTYASSSSTYGDHSALPKKENRIGKPLSPYALSKYINELYAKNYELVYGFRSVGLRYFNVFGRRQDPMGAYAAVIPKWISEILNEKEISINGDGETSRDFCYVKNAVQANILSSKATKEAQNNIYNVAVGERTSLNDLAALISTCLNGKGIKNIRSPRYREFREGDIRHSQADISKAKKMLGYDPQYNIEKGVRESIDWYVNFLK